METSRVDVDLVASLSEDHSGVALRKIRDLLEEQRAVLRRKADQGLDPETFTVCQGLQQACATASDMANGIWTRLHKQ